MNTKVHDWEYLYKSAKEAVEAAYLAIDNVAGWSGSSGNWPLHEAFVKIKMARKALKEIE